MNYVLNDWLDALDGFVQNWEIDSLKDENYLRDCFSCNLTFGTGGIRGRMGVGPNRMNLLTVGKATQGFANYLNSKRGAIKPAVVIAYDTRIHSRDFAIKSACVLAGNGIDCYLFKTYQPTPLLSYAVRNLGCDAGICITASHNPKEYNGYKLYGPSGDQATDSFAKTIQSYIELIDPFRDVLQISFEAALDQGSIKWVSNSVISSYQKDVLKEIDSRNCSNLNVIYSPLGGTGLRHAEVIFDALGVDYRLVDSQLVDDGTFPGIPKPNPENPSAMEEGIAYLKKYNADLFLATDPDADRLGVAVRDKNTVVLLTGNELGLLLLDYLSSKTNDIDNAVVVTSVVSDPLADSIALSYGFELRKTLTGFKYVGEQIDLLEKQGSVSRFLFGFEESCGYLKGSYVRDKDGINAIALTCEVASYYKNRGLTLLGALDQLHARFGYSYGKQLNWTLEGTEGKSTISSVVNSFRNYPSGQLGHFKIFEKIDYSQGIHAPVIKEGKKGYSNQILSPSNVIEFYLENGAKVIFRPSGTEPKLKAYLFVQGLDSDVCQRTLCDLISTIKEVVDKRIGRTGERPIHVILLSGGSGTRLWPLSNSARSKQFLKVLRDENGNHISMVQRVYSQICKVDASIDITIATSSTQADSLSMQIPSQYSLVTEPERRDTAPAIMLACANLYLEQNALDDDPVIVMPIDTFADQSYYDNIPSLAQAISLSNKDLILLGVEPTYPSEKYGYILPVSNQVGRVRDVASFEEKPDLQTAEKYIEKNALWNCGVFGFKLSYLRRIIEKYYVPNNYEDMLSHYSYFPKTSFDYEVVEKAANVGVISYSGMWKDLGTWNTLTDEMDEAVSGKASIDWKSCKNVHVVNETGLPLVVAGLSDSVVVATSDGILVSGKEESAHIKQLVNKVAEGEPMLVEKEWGCLKTLSMGVNQKNDRVKLVEVKCSHTLNLNSVIDGCFYLVVVRGSGELRLSDSSVHIEQGFGRLLSLDTVAELRASTELTLYLIAF